MGNQMMSAERIAEMHARLIGVEGDVDLERETNRISTLEDTSLALLPLLLTSFSSQPVSEESSSAPSTRSQIVHLLILIGQYARPKEVVLALGEGMERIVDEIGECFLSEEDEGMDDGEEESDEEPGQKSAEQGKGVHLDVLLAKTSVMLNVYAEVIPRLPTLKSLHNTLSTLPHQLTQITSEIATAAMMRAPHTAREVWRLLDGVGGIVRAVKLWSESGFGLGGMSVEDDETKVPLVKLIVETILGLKDVLHFGSLNRWYRSQFGNTLIESLMTYERRPDGESMIREKAKEADEVYLASVVDGLIESLETLGIPFHTLMQSIHTKAKTSTHLAIPIASLHIAGYILSSPLSKHQSQLQATSSAQPGSGSASATASTESPTPTSLEMLKGSMPLLGNAWNGLGVYAAGVWTWTCVFGIRKEGGELDAEMASTLIELIMPNVSSEPDSIARFAMHKLVGSLIELVADPEEQIGLYREIIEEANPFENVRIGGLQLLREYLVHTLPSRELDFRTAFLEALHLQLGSIIFTLPMDDVPLVELDLLEFVDSPHLTWLTECLSLSAILPGLGERPSKKGQALQRDWLAEVGKVFSSMRDKAGQDDIALKVDLQMFALEEALARAEASMSA